MFPGGREGAIKKKKTKPRYVKLRPEGIKLTMVHDVVME
jgi:hypothetical protein